MRRAGVLTAAFALIVSVTGCDSAPPPPPPTPVATSTPVETRLQRQTRLDFEAAEKAYRTFSAELGRVLRSGGTEKATTVMRQTAAGPYLQTYAKVAGDYAYVKGRQVGQEKLVQVNQGAYSATELNLDVCEDSRQVKSYIGKKLVGSGEILRGTVEARKIGGAWKLWDRSMRSVEVCE